MVGRGMKVRTENACSLLVASATTVLLLLTLNPVQITAEKIQQRWSTYQNDALRYAKLVSKVESFETWGRKKKMDVKARILASIDLGRTEELADHGY